MKKVIEKLIPLKGLVDFEVSKNCFELGCSSSYRWFIGQKNGSNDNYPFFVFLQKERFFSLGFKTVGMLPFVFDFPKTGTWGDFRSIVHDKINEYIYKGD
jgi:hypothetical protein